MKLAIATTQRFLQFFCNIALVCLVDVTSTLLNFIPALSCGSSVAHFRFAVFCVFLCCFVLSERGSLENVRCPSFRVLCGKCQLFGIKYIKLQLNETFGCKHYALPRSGRHKYTKIAVCDVLSRFAFSCAALLFLSEALWKMLAVLHLGFSVGNASCSASNTSNCN